MREQTYPDFTGEGDVAALGVGELDLGGLDRQGLDDFGELNALGYGVDHASEQRGAG